MEKLTPRLLNGDELKQLVKAGYITNVEDAQINAASIDVTLGNALAIEHVAGNRSAVVSLALRLPRAMRELDITNSNYTLAPQRGVLIHTEQELNLPNHISAQYRIKSSMARIGLAEAGAGWVDAGFHGSDLTLSLLNTNTNHSIVLDHGTAIGQLVFFAHEEVSEEFSYRTKGNYNKSKGVTQPKAKEVVMKRVLPNEPIQELVSEPAEQLVLPIDKPKETSTASRLLELQRKVQEDVAK